MDQKLIGQSKFKIHENFYLLQVLDHYYMLKILPVVVDPKKKLVRAEVWNGIM